jgi:alpha-L-fucosidase
MRSIGRGAGLILNIPPDDTGVIPADEVALLHEYKNLLDTRFGNKLGQVKNSNELDLKSNQTLNYITIQENIKNGQNIKSFKVQAYENNQ